jgi:uncharacterized protein (DUF433 family)
MDLIDHGKYLYHIKILLKSFNLWYPFYLREYSMPKVTHPHITSNPKICGGSAIIAGTRFPVRSVVIYILRHGLTPEELVAQFPYLTLAQVHDALTYYYDNREEIEKDIAENTEEAVRQRFSL